ncbi:terminase small subunit [Acinetobacter ursingii]|uniref:terminase small subunit n=1 Tax=Acinetobacter ursingii TaxID=108980 RepID=UPI00244734CF|nr:terminase small subunit [Acinetobacter ursingii]MDH0008380.1 terminase small subunit [Acinetobacter ursingii]MDH0480168.1 terminase small subunit [Acinetobacter ursingii]MDH2120776.1 terminase small subunit [Acinetobacter ursingii]MDH2128346.1 terminase small subunit [Acinetobacter ursingii]
MAELKKGQIVNRTGLSDVFGVALTTIDTWVRLGCPVVVRGRGKGQEWQFNTAQIAKWLQDKAADDAAGEIPDDINLLRIRKQKAETELAELMLAEKKGQVALISEFEQAQAVVFGIIRSNMMNIPQRAVLQLLGETDARIFKEKLRAEIVLALETAAEAELEDDEDV